jgi:hypothetical protein
MELTVPSVFCAKESTERTELIQNIEKMSLSLKAWFKKMLFISWCKLISDFKVSKFISGTKENLLETRNIQNLAIGNDCNELPETIA